MVASGMSSSSESLPESSPLLSGLHGGHHDDVDGTPVVVVVRLVHLLLQDVRDAVDRQ